MDDSANVFYAPLRSMPGSIKDPERARLTQDLTRAIAEKLLPASRVLHDFLQKEYLPRARTGLALSELPLGREWYAFLVKKATSSALSADEINRIGAAELERLGTLPTPEAPTSQASPPEAPPTDAIGLVNAYKELEAKFRPRCRRDFARFPSPILGFRARTGCRVLLHRCTTSQARRAQTSFL